MKTFIKIILTLSFACFLLSSTIFADSNAIKNILAVDNILHSSERGIIQSLYDSVYGIGFDQLKGWLNGNGIHNIKKMDSYIMYKVYGLKDVDLVNSYKNNKSFANLISNDYFWEVPVYNEDGKIVSTFNLRKGPLVDELKKKGRTFEKETEDLIRAEENKWNVGLIGNCIPLDGAELLSNNDDLEKFLVRNNLMDIQEFKVVFCPYTYVLYIKDKDKEYGVPFTLREDFLGIKNDNVYEMDILMNIFEQFLKTAEEKQGDVYGGIYRGIIENKNYEHTGAISITSISLTALVLLVLGLSVSFVLRRRKIQSN